jgi:hypothetical protein
MLTTPPPPITQGFLCTSSTPVRSVAARSPVHHLSTSLASRRCSSRGSASVIHSNRDLSPLRAFLCPMTPLLRALPLSFLCSSPLLRGCSGGRHHSQRAISKCVSPRKRFLHMPQTSDWWFIVRWGAPILTVGHGAVGTPSGQHNLPLSSLASNFTRLTVMMRVSKTILSKCTQHADVPSSSARARLFVSATKVPPSSFFVLSSPTSRLSFVSAQHRGRTRTSPRGDSRVCGAVPTPERGVSANTQGNTKETLVPPAR